MTVTTRTRSSPVRIGPSSFDAEKGVVLRDGQEWRLEYRAAKALELLCRHRGEIVSQDEIRDVVWNGRSVSPNSTAIVISDLRRALGDDARQPTYIQTMAKRGYVLALGEVTDRPATANDDTPTASAASVAVGRRLGLLGLAAMLVTVAVIALVWARQAPVPTIYITPVSNDTGDPANVKIATALNELEVARLSKLGKVIVGDAPAGGQGASVVRSRLIMWDGRPALSIRVIDDKGAIVWTGMASGPPFYPSVSKQLDKFADWSRQPRG